MFSYREEPDYSATILRKTSGKGVDVILDPILASNFDYNMESLAEDGRWVMYGSMGGVLVSHAKYTKLLAKRGSIIATLLRSRSDEYKTKVVKGFEKDCLEDFSVGKLRPIIDRVYKMSEVKEAHEYMHTNANVGKIVLKFDL